MPNRQVIPSAYNKEYFELKYITEKKSIRKIAEEIGVSESSIKRKLHALNIPIRNKSEGQKLVLKTGKHPTKGKKRTEEERDKISAGQSEYWGGNKNKKVYKHLQTLKERGKEKWAKMDPEERESFIKKGRKAILETTTKGSKLERLIWKELDNAGINFHIHVGSVIPNENLEVDILIRDCNTVIEVDGPTHFKPIYGLEKFHKVIAADRQKNGLLLGNGYNVIRIGNKHSIFSEYAVKRMMIGVINALNYFKENPDLPYEYRFKEIELIKGLEGLGED